MAGQKKLEASAKKALKKAKEAVGEAEAKAKKASKQRRIAAADLRSDLQKTVAKAKLEKAQLKDAKQAVEKKTAVLKKTSSKKAKAAEALADVPTPPAASASTRDLPLPHEVTVDVPTADGRSAAADLSSLTMIQLRHLAREKKIPGYSRLSKATLVERLQEA
ncbi:Rho termination factor N-terminal domain-containing protein [Frondihabitans peucedani]|uniref:Rho termination factor N-terminal domain-containing protein n=1 Tax=Frondihabitans peucedani TaxID=598626 RepID=A0ABP8E3S1_9MICO